METPDANDRANATATFCTALVPKIIEMLFSKNVATKGLADGAIFYFHFNSLPAHFKTAPSFSNFKGLLIDHYYS